MKLLWLIPPPILILIGMTIGVGLTDFRQARLGDVESNSKAHALGFRSLDVIESVGGRSIRTIQELILQAAKHPNQTLDVIVVRGQNERHSVSLPVSAQSFRFLGFKKIMGVFENLKFEAEKPVLIPKSNSPLLHLGVQAGDLVLEVEGSAVQTRQQWLEHLASLPSHSPLNIKLQRGKEILSIGVPPIGERFSVSSLGLDLPQHTIRKVHPRSLGAQLGLQPNDRFIMIQNEETVKPFSFSSLLMKLRATKKLTVVVVREDKVQNLNLEVADLPEIKAGDFSDFLNWLKVESFQSYLRPNPVQGSLGIWSQYWLTWGLWSRDGGA